MLLRKLNTRNGALNYHYVPFFFLCRSDVLNILLNNHPVE